MLSVVRPDGSVVRGPPGRFGAITNAHHVKLGGQWDSSFKQIFNQPDSEITSFVQWINALDARESSSESPMVERITPQTLNEDQCKKMARIFASLLARSPATRHSIRIDAEHYRREFGLSEPTASKTLVAANQRGLYDAYRRPMEWLGRWAVLFSDELEFISGDGFFHNFPASRDSLGSGLKLVLPILPTAAIVYMKPTEYTVEPKLVTIRMSAKEVEAINNITQVYLGGVMFFRANRPTLSEHFLLGEHLIFQYHRNHWLDSMLDDLSQYTRRGRDGKPSLGSQRPYSGNPISGYFLGGA
jgi:hypothetical protein